MTRGDSFLGKVIGGDDEADAGPVPAVAPRMISEPDKAGDFTAPAEADLKMPLPSDLPTIFLGGLFILAALTVKTHPTMAPPRTGIKPLI